MKLQRILAYACALGALSILLSSCLSAPGPAAGSQADLRGAVESDGALDALDPGELDEIEIRIVSLKSDPASKPPKAEVQRLIDRLAELRRAKGQKDSFAIRLYALSGEAYLLSGDSVSAKEMLKNADDLAGYGSKGMATDPAPLLRVLLVPTKKKKLSLLESSAKPVLWSGTAGGVPPRLQCELAVMYMSESRYAEALASFDLAMARLPEGLRAAYAPARERCQAALSAGVSAVDEDIAAASPLSLKLFLRAILEEAPDLVARPQAQDDKALAQAFLDAKLLPPGSSIDPGRAITRADMVLPLFALYVRRSGESGLETKYSLKYAKGSGGASPIPDIPYGSEIFDEAIALVEREVMDLVDGKLFMPEREVSGLQFLAALKKLPAAGKP